MKHIVEYLLSKNKSKIIDAFHIDMTYDETITVFEQYGFEIIETTSYSQYLDNLHKKNIADCYHERKNKSINFTLIAKDEDEYYNYVFNFENDKLTYIAYLNKVGNGKLTDKDSIEKKLEEINNKLCNQ